MKLNGKVSIITGGARGIGRKICEYFLEEGAITYIFDINESDGAEVLGKFKSIFGKDKVYFYKVDITNEDQVKKVVGEIAAAQQGIDILVNNAGITIDSLIMRMALEDWNKVMAVNLTGAFICSKHIVRHMMKKRSGKIINMASIVGVHGNAGQCNYSASKAGIIGLTKSLAKELSSRNIKVNAIAPGYIETEMTGKLDQEIKEKLISMIPTGKLGSVDDVAKAVLFLASEDSNYITGIVLNLDGGMGI